MKNKKKVCKAAEQVKEVVQNTNLNVEYYFCSPIYIIDRLDFLGSVSKVSQESLDRERKQKSLDELYPVMMSGNYYDDPRINDFVQFVGETAWNILNTQGYAMHDKNMLITEMWTQEHHKHSAMEQHTHGYGSQIVGFYFLDVPENSSKAIFYDPRAGKVQTDLPEQNQQMATLASKMINFQPRPGMMIFTNSWLAHSFTRHGNDKPLKFVHFNLTTQVVQPSFTQTMPTAEVI